MTIVATRPLSAQDRIHTRVVRRRRADGVRDFAYKGAMRLREWMWKVVALAALVWVAACGGSSSGRAERGAAFGAAPTHAPGGLAVATISADSVDSEGDSGGEEMMAQNAPMEAEPPPAQAPPAKPKPAPTATDGTSTQQQTAPLLIYTANYTMAVFEVTKSIDDVQALAKKLGGYLVRRDDRAITIRVPAAQYTAALGDVAKMGDVLHREETVEDVTEQFFDMKTRLDNARAMRIRLQELLAAAKDVKDALAVEKELARVTETIERIEGKLKRLRELINFSTITVAFNAHNSENVNSNVNLPFSWLDQLGLGPLLRLR